MQFRFDPVFDKVIGRTVFAHLKFQSDLLWCYLLCSTCVLFYFQLFVFSRFFKKFKFFHCPGDVLFL